MNYNKDKIDLGVIKHVFKTDKFEPSGLDIVFNSSIAYSFTENDVVVIDSVSKKTTINEIDYRVNNKKFIFKLKTPMIVSELKFMYTSENANVNSGNRTHEAVFEQLDETTLSVVLLRTDMSLDGTYYDVTNQKYTYNTVNGAFKVSISGKECSPKNGIYIVKKEEWEMLTPSVDTLSDVSYSLQCSAVSVLGLVKVILPHNSEPAIPELVPEVTSELKMVDHIYLSPNVLLLNLVRISNSNSGYRENIGTTTSKTVLNEKLNFSSFVPDFSLYFAAHSVKKDIIFGSSMKFKSGRTTEIKWDYAKVSSIKNVFLQKTGLNSEHEIDGIKSFILNDVVIIRKQDENEENGVYMFDGEKFKSKYTYGEQFDDHFIIKEGSKRVNFGVHVFGVYGYLVNFVFTSGILKLTPPFTSVEPKITSAVPTTNNAADVLLDITVKKPSIDKPLDIILIILAGSLILILFIKSLRRTAIPVQVAP
jgi:hypothetical protein